MRFLQSRPRCADAFLPLCLLVLFCGSSLALLVSCSGRGEVKPDGPPYSRLIEKWTSEGKVYRGMESRLVVHATYRGWGLREAYVREYEKRYRLDSYQREKLLAGEKARYEEGEEFFLAVYTPEGRWNDLDRSDSVWKLYLKNDRDERVSPVEVRRVDEESPLIREFYPDLDPWSYGYVVIFPKYSEKGELPLINDETRSFTLIITGVLGQTEITWRLK
ncbi:MAG: hypothetical protein ACE5GF_03225 [Thermodesulfobacteriota bacterium]